MVRRAHPSDLLCLHLAVAGFGFAGVFGKLLALSPVMIVAGRTGFAALTLGILVSLRPSLRGVATPGSGWWLIPPGVLLAVHWWMFFEAVQTSTVAVALVSFSTFPVLVILWDACMSRRAPTLLDLVAVVVAFLGVGLIVPRFDLSEFVFRGVLWGLGSGATFAMILRWNRWRVMDGSPIWLAMIQNAVAFAVLLPTVAAEWVLPSVRSG